MDRQIPTGQDKVAANTTIVWFRHENTNENPTKTGTKTERDIED